MYAVLCLLAPAAPGPPASEIYSGKALNGLLQQIFARDGRGARVPLDGALLPRLNLAPPGSGNFGLLKNGGKLTWPGALADDKFKAERVKVERLLRRALVPSRGDPTKGPDRAHLAGLDRAVKGLHAVLAEAAADLSPSQYIEAKRYLNLLGEGVRVLQRPDAEKFLSGTYAARGKTVGELADHIRRQGLVFAPAVPGDEAAYLAAYRALRAYLGR